MASTALLKATMFSSISNSYVLGKKLIFFNKQKKILPLINVILNRNMITWSRNIATPLHYVSMKAILRILKDLMVKGGRASKRCSPPFFLKCLIVFPRHSIPDVLLHSKPDKEVMWLCMETTQIILFLWANFHRFFFFRDDNLDSRGTGIKI